MLAVQRAARRVLVWQTWLLLISLALVTLTGLGLLDYIIRAPSWMRIATLIAGLVTLVWLIRRWVVPALRFAPPLSSIALRLEKRDTARELGLEARLASGLELAQRAQNDELARRAVEEAEGRFDPAIVRDVVRTVRLRRRAACLGLVLTGLALLAFWQPSLTMTGAQRVLTPWSDAAWPKRTKVVNATTIEVHPAGETLPVRAILARSQRPASQTDVTLRYRLVRDGNSGPLRSALLTSQERVAQIGSQTNIQNEQAEGVLFEHLLEPLSFEGETASLEYWIETADDRTPTASIRLVTPPEVLGVTAMVRLPEYAAEIGDRQNWIAGNTDLGAGRDDRAIVGPVLAGSEITLEAKLSKDIPGPNGELDTWILDTLGENAADLQGLAVHADGSDLLIAWTATDPVRIEIHPKDSFGLRSTERSALTFDVISDAEPTVSIITPVRDEAVLATALIPLEAEARDDVGLSELWLSRQTARPPTGSGETSPGALPEADGEEAVIVRTQTDRSRLTVNADLDLSPLGLRPGDEVRLIAYASDLQQTEPAQSPARILTIISEADLIDSLLADLAAVRRSAINTDREQDQLSTRLKSGEVGEELRESQNRVTARVSAMLDTFERAQERMERNGLDDGSLESLIRDSANAARNAAASSAEASRSLEEAADKAEEGEDTEEEAAEALQSQEEVRDQLERVAKLLDQGEDAWAVRRSLESLISDQQQLASDTQEAGARTGGRPMSELTPAELTELDRIAQRQLELAEQAEQVLDELDERADAIAESDEGQAAAMRAAAQQGRQSGVAGSMSQASQQVGQNQTGEAGQNQQDAMEALDEMLQSLDEAEAQRREALKRQLASMAESVQNLIRMQETEIQQLSQRAPPAELSQGMARLHRATIAVHGEAMASVELEDAAALLDEASEHQADAAGDLRVVPAETDAAMESENSSLGKLNEALAEINRLKEEAEKDDIKQRRNELRKAYTELLELQAVLRDETGRYDAPRLTRRDRADVRALSRRQGELHERGENIRTQTEGLGDAAAFSLAHDRLAKLQSGAAERLGNADGVKRALLEQGSSVRLLRGLIDALAEDKSQEEFGESASGAGGGEGGGSGGPQPLVPPIAELKLLRAMQEEALTLTKLADDSGGQEISSAEVAELQTELVELGQKMIEQMQQPQQPAEPSQELIPDQSSREASEDQQPGGKE